MRVGKATIENLKFEISILKFNSFRGGPWTIQRFNSSTIQRFLQLVVFLITAPFVSPAASPNAEFEQANKLYEQGKFKQAAAAYQSLIDRGAESPTIYYNVGNAWYKSGQNARAVAAYLHAERLAPRDPNVRFNLGFVRNKVNVGKISTGTVLQRALRHLSLNEWTVASALALWLWLLLLAARELRPAWRFALRGYALAAGVLTLLLASATAAALYDQDHVKPAVVIVPEAAVHYGPLEESHTFYTLSDGAEIRILEDQPQNSWVRVEDGRSRQGWLKRDQVLLVF